jgi:hypothetical protein
VTPFLESVIAVIQKAEAYTQTKAGLRIDAHSAGRNTDMNFLDNRKYHFYASPK